MPSCNTHIFGIRNQPKQINGRKVFSDPTKILERKKKKSPTPMKRIRMGRKYIPSEVDKNANQDTEDNNDDYNCGDNHSSLG